MSTDPERKSEYDRAWLLVFQFILQKQCHFLIDSVGLPADVEVAVRDLWTLQLFTPCARVLFEDKGSAPMKNERLSSEDDSDSLRRIVKRLLRSRRERSRSFSALISSEDESSQSDAEGKAGSKFSNPPRLIDTLAICYLACLLLRLPVRIVDLHNWVDSWDLLYCRAGDVVPSELRTRLGRRGRDELAIPTLLPDRLHRAVLNLRLEYQTTFRLKFPHPDGSVVILQYVRDLGLPIEVYAATRALAMQRRRALPESRFVGYLVIATLLLFDSHVHTNDWEAWLRNRSVYHQDRASESQKLAVSRIRELTRHTDMIMQPGELDAYMKWYRRIYTSTRLQRNVRARRTDLLASLTDAFTVGGSRRLSGDGFNLRQQQEHVTRGLTSLDVCGCGSVESEEPDASQTQSSSPHSKLSLEPDSKHTIPDADESSASTPPDITHRKELSTAFIREVSRASALSIDTLSRTVSTMVGELKTLTDNDLSTPQRVDRPSVDQFWENAIRETIHRLQLPVPVDVKGISSMISALQPQSSSETGDARFREVFGCQLPSSTSTPKVEDPWSSRGHLPDAISHEPDFDRSSEIRSDLERGRAWRDVQDKYRDFYRH